MWIRIASTAQKDTSLSTQCGHLVGIFFISCATSILIYGQYRQVLYINKVCGM